MLKFGDAIQLLSARADSRLCVIVNRTEGLVLQGRRALAAHPPPAAEALSTSRASATAPLAVTALELGNFADGARLANAVGPAATAAGAPWLETISMSFRAYEALHQGDILRAEELELDMLARIRERGEL